MNAGKYRHRISILQTSIVTDSAGFQSTATTEILTVYAQVKTFKGSTLIKNDTDFEKATTAFIFRKPKTAINRDMLVRFAGQTFTIQYLNELRETHELEIQSKEVEH